MNKIFRSIILSLALIMLMGSLSVFAVTPYKSYTYSIEGEPQQSPDAYVPDTVLTTSDMGLDEKGLNTPSDMVVGEDGSIYLADTKNDRIVVLNSNYKLKFYLNNFINYYGVEDSLSKPQGVYATTSYIYVADTENSRIVLFDLEGNYVRTLDRPSSDIFEEGELYKPVAVAVDKKSGRIFVVSSTTYQGVMSLNENGEFQGYIGAEKVTIGFVDRLWRSLMTKEQRKTTKQYVSTELNNLTIDSDGFIYITTSAVAEALQQAAIKNGSSKNAPVRKINTSGRDIMSRNGFFGPGGEVNVLAKDDPIGASKIVDVAVGSYGSWSIIDAKRSKVYTYNENGELLFVFGDKGGQVGNVQSAAAITYNGSDILVLDNTQNTITIYKRTEYGDLLLNALRCEDERLYDEAAENWRGIIQRNSNFDAAYIGVGRMLYRSGQYKEAMEYFRSAYDTENYSSAFSSYRRDIVSKYIWVIPIVLVAVILAYRFFFRYANRVNREGRLKTTKRTWWEEILYGFYLMFHPFDGFWDLKHEKRGSLRGALVILAATVISFAYYLVGSAYLVFPRGNSMSAFLILASVVLPVLLWTIANWCLTTLFDGEGSFKDIFIATCYSLMPIVLLMIPVTICTHGVTLTELPLLTMLLTFSYIWTGLLIFFGMMVTHDYTFLKNIIISICTIIGMAFIMFMAVLFAGLLQNIVGFITSIVVELSYRV